MSFYSDWKSAGLSDEKYINDFLSRTSESIDPLLTGSAEEQKEIFDILSEVKFNDLLAQIQCKDCSDDVKPAGVPQFSSFSDGFVRVNELLEFSDEPLSFYELGYQMVKANKIGACVKYGENHSKLARLADMVVIERKSSCLVSSSAWGSFLALIPLDEKDDVIRKLLLREYIVQKILSGATNGVVTYTDIVSCLAETTAIRRRSNVKQLIEFVLQGTGNEYLNNNIIW